MPEFSVAIIPVTPFEQNCTLVWCKATKRAAVVDPGGDLDRVEEAIRRHGVAVERILLTHGHVDHAAGAAELKERLGVLVEGPHRDDATWLENLPEAGATYGIAARAVTPDHWLEEGDTVTVGEVAFSVLHCPGHSPGSVVFVNEPARFALMGDVLFRGSVGRTDLPGGDPEALIRSIRTKILPRGDDLAFICGHGPSSTVGRERVSNPFLTA